MSEVTGKEVLVKSFRAQGPAGEEIKGAIWRDQGTGPGGMAAPFKTTFCMKVPGSEDFCTTRTGIGFGVANALFSGIQNVMTTMGWKVLEII